MKGEKNGRARINKGIVLQAGKKFDFKKYKEL